MKPIALIVIFCSLILSIYFAKNSSISRRYQQVQTEITSFRETVAPIPTRMHSNSLPDSYLIKTAFIPQAPEKNWDEPWQDACEEASLLTVDYFYKNHTPTTSQILLAYQNLFDYEKSQSWTSDINSTQMAQIGSKYFGYKTKIITNPTLEEIKSYVSQNIPVIVPAAGKVLYRENKYFKNEGPYYHNIVILGYSDHDQKFTVHDVGTQFGAYFKYSYSLLLSSIHDFPSTGKKEDILLGQQSVLVLIK